MFEIFCNKIFSLKKQLKEMFNKEDSQKGSTHAQLEPWRRKFTPVEQNKYLGIEFKNTLYNKIRFIDLKKESHWISRNRNTTQHC